MFQASGSALGSQSSNEQPTQERVEVGLREPIHPPVCGNYLACVIGVLGAPANIELTWEGPQRTPKTNPLFHKKEPEAQKGERTGPTLPSELVIKPHPEPRTPDPHSLGILKIFKSRTIRNFKSWKKWPKDPGNLLADGRPVGTHSPSARPSGAGPLSPASCPLPVPTRWLVHHQCQLGELGFWPTPSSTAVNSSALDVVVSFLPLGRKDSSGEHGTKWLHSASWSNWGFYICSWVDHSLPGGRMSKEHSGEEFDLTSPVLYSARSRPSHRVNCLESASLALCESHSRKLLGKSAQAQGSKQRMSSCLEKRELRTLSLIQSSG